MSHPVSPAWSYRVETTGGGEGVVGILAPLGNRYYVPSSDWRTWKTWSWCVEPRWWVPWEQSLDAAIAKAEQWCALANRREQLAGAKAEQANALVQIFREIGP